MDDHAPATGQTDRAGAGVRQVPLASVGVFRRAGSSAA